MKDKIHILYEKGHPQGGVPYVGRVSGKGDINNPMHIDRILRKRDRNHHMNSKGFKQAEPLRVSPNPDPIRGIEQIQIDINGGAKSMGGTSSNTINGIRNKNPKRPDYIAAAQKEFGK